jgi:hypothetical protein
MIENIKRLFVNELMEFPNGAHPNHARTDIDKIDYTLNSLGYRSDEFDGKSEILFLGCSHTYGQGLPKEDVWAHILSKKLNLSSSSLAARGDSVMGQVSKAFYYFEKFGNPKIVVALFPFSRIITPYTEGKMEAKNEYKRKKFKEHDYMPLVEYSETWGSFAKYAKAPYDPQYILTEEFVFFYENIFIDMLRQYCKSNNIKFVWSNWDPMYQEDIYNEVNSFYPQHHESYCYIEAFDWKIPNHEPTQSGARGEADDYGEFNALDCHSDYDRNHELFYRGADRKDGHPPHWGTHKQLHIAEDFYNFIVDKL